MKKLYCLILILFSCLLFGQTLKPPYAHYKLEVKGKIEGEGSNCGNNKTGGLQWIAAIYEQGGNKTLISGTSAYPGTGRGIKDTPIDEKLTFTEDNKVVKLAYHTTRRSGGWTCGETKEVYQNVTISTCHSQYFDFKNNGLNQPGNTQIIITPIVELEQPKNNIIGEESLYIPPIQGVHSKYYKWEYSIGNLNNFQPFPNQYQYKNYLDIVPKNVFPINALGKILYIRVNTGCNNYTSTSIFYEYRLSSPYVLPNPDIKNTSCFDTNDGQVRFSFDRELELNETLNLTIVDLNKPTTIIGEIQHYETVDSKVNITVLNEENTRFTNLAAGNYRLELIGKYNDLPTFTDGANHTKDFIIKKPEPVSFEMVKITDIRCYGGQDGGLKLTASGGQNKYLYQVEYPNGQLSGWIPFTSGNTAQLPGLNVGIYRVQVKDSNGCIARKIIMDQIGNNIIGLGEEITKTETIDQPEKALNIDYVDSKNPTAFGFFDGYIKANITGGTPYKGNPKLYSYIWKHEDGTSWSQIAEEVIVGNEGWFLTLNQAKSGKYILTVTDKNYNEAVDKEGCTVFESEFILIQPDPLQATLEVSKQISCNFSNEYGDETDQNPIDEQRDESQNGALIAHVTGGIQPYIYTWKKKLNGIWTTINTHINQPETSIAFNLSDGNYAFNVKDANGVILGEYINNQLIIEKDEIFYLHEPAQLKLETEFTEISCNPGNNGSIKVTAIGGIAPYSYVWTNGEITPEIKNLIAGVYKVWVTDASGCVVEGNIMLSQPGEIEVEPVAINPTCYGGSDGFISVSVKGGETPYEYEWSTGETSSVISNLKQGIYTLKIIDARGCTAVKEIEIKDPEQIILNLGLDRVLCNQQELSLDAAINDIGASYQWSSTNGFTSTSPKVILKEPGIYTVIVTTYLGCTLMDEITISHFNKDISSEFLLTSQAYVNEEVILVNVSNPIGETTHWEIPNKVQVVNENYREIALRFLEKGTYKIGLISTQGDCFEYYEKNIIVEENRNLPNPGATDNPFIQEFSLAPNPNNGNFQIKVKLAEQSPISIRIFDIIGTLVSEERKVEGKREYELDYHLTNLGSATYIIVLETAKGTKVKRMITY